MRALNEKGGGYDVDDDTDDKKTDTDTNTDSNSSNEQPTVTAVTMQVDSDEAAELFKQIMIANGLSYISLTNGVFNSKTDSSYRMFVLGSDTMLANMYINGVRVSMGQYTLVHNKNGTFTIVLNGDFMRSLGKGDHVLKLELDGNHVIECTIRVE